MAAHLLQQPLAAVDAAENEAAQARAALGQVCVFQQGRRIVGAGQAVVIFPEQIDIAGAETAKQPDARRMARKRLMSILLF
ncbi:hypothetical protein [Massilia sp. NR 4-1]|uniref:hypothetical protein n=1 Tax=Massilia sp. NR 4-1 TaxID=1678028 RepID=UPI00067DB7E3|nr:hypothetical protein [Massilia sp. NR 4-1]